MPETTTPQLTESDVEAIEARANAASSGPWLVTDGQHIDQYDHHPDGNRLLSEGDYDANYHLFSQQDVAFIAHARTDIPALIRDWRALKARNSELESSVTFWQAEALLNHFCSEHAKNTRQIGHYCAICARPFVMSVPQGERPPKYKDLIAENAALREQLAQAELAQERLQTAVQLALQGLNERCSEVAALQWFQSEYCFAVEKVRNADESTIFELRKGLPTLTGKQLPTGVGP